MKTILSFFIFFYSFIVLSQTALWTDRIAANGNNHVFNVKVDSATGHTYATGRVKGVGTFGEMTNSTTPTTWGDRDIFLTNNDPNGNLIWVKRFGGLYTDYGMCIEISTNHIYLGGYFTDTIWVDNDTLVSTGAQDAFSIKLDKLGNVIWAKSWGGSSIEQFIESYIDENENVYYVGHFKDSVHFDGIDLINTIPLSYPIRDPSFLVKMDSSGNIIWAKKQQSTRRVKPWDVAVSDGYIYMAGNLYGAVDFDGIVYNSINNSYYDQFIAKYDTSGNFIWTKMFGYNWHDTFTTIQIGDDNDMYACGYCRGPVTYGNNSINVDAQSAVGVKLDTSGAALNVFVIPGTGLSEFDGLTFQNNCVFFGGYFSDSIFVENDTIVSFGGLDAYLVELDTAFNVLSDYQEGAFQDDQIRCLAQGIDGNIAIGGSFHDLVDFGTVSFFAVSAKFDGYVTEFCPKVHINTVASDSTICEGEIIYFINKTKGGNLFQVSNLPATAIEVYNSSDSIGVQFNSANSYTIETIVQNDCSIDSIEYNIEVFNLPSVDLGLDISSCDTVLIEINAVGVFDSIYWSTAEFNVNQINVTSSGVYSAEVWNSEGCNAVDSIVVVLTDCSGIEDSKERTNNLIGVYFEGLIQLYPEMVFKNEPLFNIFDMQGRLIQSGKVIQNSIKLTQSLNSAVYLILFEFEEGSKTLKLRID